MFGNARVWGAIVPLLALGLAIPAAADTLKFKFKESSDANGWQAITQKWKVKDKGYRPFLQVPAYPFAILDKPQFEDVEATFEINDLSPANFAGGTVRSKVNGIGLDGYVVLLSNSDDVTGLIQLYKFTNFLLDGSGGDASVLCDGNINIEPKMTVTLTAKGSKLRAFYNGSAVCSANDVSFKKGRIGLFTNYAPGESPAYRSVVLVD
jgi:hypothetical protein